MSTQKEAQDVSSNLSWGEVAGKPHAHVVSFSQSQWDAACNVRIDDKDIENIQSVTVEAGPNEFALVTISFLAASVNYPKEWSNEPGMES